MKTIDMNTKEIIKQTSHVIENVIPWRMKYDETPGLSLGIVYKGELVYSNNFGYADLEKKIRPTKETLYHIASNSKTFTAVSIMQLVEKGKLRLDDKICDYVDWFNAKDKNKDSRNITIRQILSHAGGLFRDGDTPHWETGDFPEDLKRSFNADSLILENATRFKYTNYGFSLLGLVIEKASGLTYGEYVRKNILEPLKMDSTAPDYSDGMTGIATGYGRVIPGEKRQVFPHYRTNAYAPATGFVSNVSDLAKYISALSLNSKKLLNRESKKEMMHLQEYISEDEYYGLGLEGVKIRGRNVVGHGGGFNGYITRTMLDPELDLGVIVLTNSISGGAGNIAHGIMEVLYGALDNPLNHSGKLPDYGRFEGLYRDVWGDGIVVQFGKKLLAVWPGISNLRNPPTLDKTKNPDIFIYRNKNLFDSYDEPVIFKDFKNGKAQVMVRDASPSKRIEYKD